MCTGSLLPLSSCLNPVDNGPQYNWEIVVEKTGSTNVAVTITTAGQDSLTLYVPKTCQNFQIIPTLNYNRSSLFDRSYDKIQIDCENVGQLSLSYVWPDGAVQYNGKFYFAGQEKPYVGKGKIAIILPEDSFVSWIEGYEHFSGNVTKELSFTVDSLQPMSSFAYSFSNMSQIAMQLETSEHVNLIFYPIMKGEPWIEETLEILENQWNWMENLLEGTINKVNITFAPYGYNDLGTKKDGLCYYGTRNIEIAATNQFGIGTADGGTALLLHEVAHALTPLLEAFPSFYSEAIAQDFSYDTLRRTELNASVDELEEAQFNRSYNFAVQEGLLHYVYNWKWDNEIYGNATISDACYGTVAFIGDFFVHRLGYDHYHKLIEVFNSTEISELSDAQKLPKFLEYMSEACGFNVTQILDTIPFMITRWFDAYNLRNEFRSYQVYSLGPFTESAQEIVLSMIRNATQDYDTRDFESAINKFNQVKEYVNSLQNQDASYWKEQQTSWQNIALAEGILFAAIVILIICYYRRKLRVTQKRYLF